MQEKLANELQNRPIFTILLGFFDSNSAEIIFLTLVMLYNYFILITYDF
jgi:hypothetical protein